MTLTPSYQLFLNECPTVLKCAYGNEIALGLQGDHAKVVNFETLMANLDYEGSGLQRITPKLNWLWDGLGYISTSSARVIKAVERHFVLRIRFSEECMTHTTVEDEQVTRHHDEEEIQRRARFAAEKWWNEEVKVRSFLPPAPKVTEIDYATAFYSDNLPDSPEEFVKKEEKNLTTEVISA